MAQADPSPIRFGNPAHVRKVLKHCLDSTQPRRFVVECLDREGNSYFPEVNDSESSLAAIVCALVDGQFDHIVAVREIGPDVSEEIAKAVARHCDEYGVSVTSDVCNFLEDNGQFVARHEDVGQFGVGA